MKIEDKYTSRDLALVAYLVASDFPLESYKVGKEGLVLFTFYNSLKLQQHIIDFFRMTSTVNPVAYYNSLRTLKSMLKSERHDYYNQNENKHVPQHYIEQ
jgi:hypothetical protein